MKRYSLILWLLLASACWGQTVQLPGEIKGDVGRLLAIKVVWSGDDLKWTASSDLDVFREYDPDSQTVRLRLIGYKPGKFELKAIACKDKKLSDFSTCVIVVGQPGPDPPPIPPPDPTDPLTKALQTAFDKETDANRNTLKTSLAAFYRQSAEITGKAEITTWGGLFDVMRAAAGTLGVSGKLPALQGAIALELTSKLPTDRTKLLDVAGRTLAADTFKRVALSLETVKEVK